MDIGKYPSGFEEDHDLRSAFIRELTLEQLGDRGDLRAADRSLQNAVIPKTLVRYWHDLADLPADVGECISSWDHLAGEGFELRLFDDTSARDYIARSYGARELASFGRCRHPAMRCDYFRMCFILAEGGLYVDADDVLIGEAWRSIFQNGRLKLQPLCYDIQSQRMVPAVDIWRADLPTSGRIFYVNNDPIAAPPNHPVVRRALTAATDLLLGDEPLPEIQATTGPGILTANLAAYARELNVVGLPLDFELLRNWDEIAETRWHLSYRGDERNWRIWDTGVAR